VVPAFPVEDPGVEALELIRRWRNDGFRLSNHSLSHPNLNATAADLFLANVDQADAFLREHFGADCGREFFRYPYLCEGDSPEKHAHVRAALGERGLRIARVTVNFGDWIWNNVYTDQVEAGQTGSLALLRNTYLHYAVERLILAHDSSERLFGRQIPHVLLAHAGVFNALMMPELLHLYQELGVEFISLDEALRDRAYTEAPAEFLPSRYTYLHQLAQIAGVAHPLFEARPETELKQILARAQEGEPGGSAYPLRTARRPQEAPFGHIPLPLVPQKSCVT
jgi:peptidoglycan/xylan/chitin deacetylase (PgdA/CDA1 family)